MITTAQTMVQLMNEQRYEETVWSMERILMDGGSVSLELVDQLPNTWVCKSALLLQLQGGHCAYKGELAEAYALLKQAVQGFARMGLQLMMLDSMAQLAAVCLRIGEWQDAQTLLKFLHMEWERKESFVGGKVLHVLARGSYLIDTLKGEDSAYKEAEGLFIQAGANLCCMQLYADRLLDPISDISELELERIGINAEQKSRLDPTLYTWGQFIKGLIHSRREQWEQAITAFSTVKSDELSYEYAALYWIRRIEAELLTEREIDDTLWNQLNRLEAALSSDMPIQLQVCGIRYLQAKWRGSRIDADRLHIKLQAWLELVNNSSYSAWITQWESRLRAQNVTKPNTDRSWNISCFGTLTFINADIEVKNVKWKRKKALELFVYLLIQPDLSAPKERAMEVLLQQVDADKMNNQLYVIIHQLKQTLKQELRMESAIVIKDGTLSFNKQLLGQVDLVNYHNLTRMGDQAWGTDYELAVDFYNQAKQLYGDLIPELHYVDWLEAYRESLVDKQVGILRKMALYYSTQDKRELAEVYYGQWIEIRPLEEEGYQAFVEFLISTGRESEARRWYGKWEQVCRKELGWVPFSEMSKMVYGGSSTGVVEDETI
ncbi:BTAD domain-containing putative transcriptional regulator [Paenibacillus sp. FSL H7-0331]|uniref:bacterial transcriptional activator domain-containing protein n=1 Tax=Paenibacillus sp. FSL H7-0331 TaxID=1920421 RepID=UPI00096BE5EB|nr:BTAD domain-containing putative transcriptional regulator [Paenibacillus sp. FSL H7-0331]OMF13053.1 hypothetical protein BK127_20880 [Paenibacillus sp. FSL H7-0331]